MSRNRTRSSSKRGPMNRARTSFTGMPPQRSLKEGTTMASFGNRGYRLCFRANGTRIQHGTICRDPNASRNAAAGWLCPITRTDPSITFLYGQACPWQNPTSSIRKPYAGLKRTLRGTMFFSMPSWLPWAMYTSRNLRAARDPDSLLVQLFLEPDVQVRHDEDVVHHERRLIGNGFQIHVRSKGRSA